MSVKRIRRRGRVRKRVRVGVPDPSLTATAGVAAIAEFVDKLDVVGRFDRGVGQLKKRDRGASAGELLVAMAQSQLLGGDALVCLDRQRADVAAGQLSAVPGLASTTAAGLARRFGPEHLAGVEAAIADLVERSVDLLPIEKATSLALEGRDTDRTELAIALLKNLRRRITQWENQDPQLMADYRRVCSSIGQEVRLEAPTGDVVGVVEGIADDGRINVGGEYYSAGDVTHLRPVQ